MLRVDVRDSGDDKSCLFHPFRIKVDFPQPGAPITAIEISSKTSGWVYISYSARENNRRKRLTRGV